jgi:hypothetical protein
MWATKFMKLNSNEAQIFLTISKCLLEFLGLYQTGLVPARIWSQNLFC